MNVRTFPELPGPVLIERRLFADSRGHFVENYHAERYREIGLSAGFVQINCSRSRKGVLRGLHFQHPQPQGKLVSVTRGVAFDVAVDIRVGSPRFGKWIAVELSSDNGRQLYVPPDFAHGFVALSDVVDLLYQCTAAYVPDAEKTLLWDDPEVAIDWPLRPPLLSDKDAAGHTLASLKRDAALPVYQASPDASSRAASEAA